MVLANDAQPLRQREGARTVQRKREHDDHEVAPRVPAALAALEVGQVGNESLNGKKNREHRDDEERGEGIQLLNHG